MPSEIKMWLRILVMSIIVSLLFILYIQAKELIGYLQIPW